MDIVLVVEALDKTFVTRFWEFIEAGKYQVREKATGERELYRFQKPQDVAYPVMLEIFTRKPLRIELGAGQHIVPVKFDRVQQAFPQFCSMTTITNWISIFPLHRSGRFVVLTDVSHELSLQIRDGSEYTSRDDIALDFAEPQLDLI